MAKAIKKSKRELELEQEVAGLRGIVTQAALGASRTNAPQRAISEVWVGVRNISDLTVGILSPFQNEPDLQLYADIGEPNPGTVAVISYAWWLQLRKHKHVANGLMMRDDRVLGDSWAPAPPDRAEDLPAMTSGNQILDPVQWIESKTEAEIREGLAGIKAVAGLYRLRRAVDDKLRTLQDAYAYDDPNRATGAYSQLPAMYVLVDNLTSQRLSDATP